MQQRWFVEILQKEFAREKRDGRSTVHFYYRLRMLRLYVYLRTWYMILHTKNSAPDTMNVISWFQVVFWTSTQVQDTMVERYHYTKKSCATVDIGKELIQ